MVHLRGLFFLGCLFILYIDCKKEDSKSKLPPVVLFIIPCLHDRFMFPYSMRMQCDRSLDIVYACFSSSSNNVTYYGYNISRSDCELLSMGTQEALYSRIILVTNKKNVNIVSFIESLQKSSRLSGFISMEPSVPKIGRFFSHLFNNSSTNDLPKHWIIIISSWEVCRTSFEIIKNGSKHILTKELSLTGRNFKLLEDELIGFREYFRSFVILRISEMYGNLMDSLGVSIFLNNMILRALTNSVLDLVTPPPMTNLIHVDDVMSVIVHTISWLQLKTNNSHFEVFNIGSNESIELKDILRVVYQVTQSESPRLKLPAIYAPVAKQFGVFNTSRFYQITGYSQHQISLFEGVVRYVMKLTERDLRTLTARLENKCSDHREPDTSLLHNCHVGLYSMTGITKTFHVTCRHGQLKMSSTGSGIIMKLERNTSSSFRLYCGDNTSLTLPQYLSHDKRRNRISASRNLDSGGLMRLVYNHSKGTFLLRVDSSDDTPAKFDSRSPQYMSVLLTPDHAGLVVSSDPSDCHFAVVPFACPPISMIGVRQKVVLPLIRDDSYALALREVYSTDYKEGNRDNFPMDIHSRSLSFRCKRLLFATRRLTASLVRLRNLTRPFPNFRPKAANVTGDLESWSWASSKVLCDDVCGVGLVGGCVNTGRCRCVQPRCTTDPAAEPLFDDPINSTASTDLKTAFESLPRDELFHPHVRPFLGRSWSAPKYHVLNIPDRLLDGARSSYTTTRLRWNATAYRSQCFQADSFTLDTLAKSTYAKSLAEADLVFVPFFHGYLVHTLRMLDQDVATSFRKVWNHVARLTRGKIKPNAKFVFVLSHDMGGCLSFRFHVLLQRKANNAQVPQLKQSIILSPMGDYNTNCFLPHKDVVISPVSCFTNPLIRKFSKLNAVKPAASRKYFIFFKGAEKGTGQVPRIRLISHQLYPNTPRDRLLFRHSKGFKKLSFMTILNETVFCPHAPGVAGWSPRLSESIYSGCIPVLIAGYTAYPYQELLDYDKFTVTVRADELDRLEEVLQSIPLEVVRRKQLWALRVRDFFLYDQNQAQMHLRQQRSPIFMSLLSLKIRMSTAFHTFFD